MKFGKVSKRQILLQEYQNEISEELKNNSIVLSFAFTIILVGIFSIFMNGGDGLLIGIAISTLLLTIIQCFSNGNTILNILPIFTMMFFGFFQESIESFPIIKGLFDESCRNFIVFLAFSLSFITQAYKNVLYKHDLKKRDLDANNKKNKMMLAQLSSDQKMVNMARHIQDVSNSKDSVLTQAVDELVDYIDSESFLTTIKSSLILKGSEEGKTTFDVEEVEESILMSNGGAHERDILADKNNNLSLDRTEPDPFDFDFKFQD